jgi:hypothetical protein
MSFFNKKEEVLEIELTSYGKSLLAKGKLRPTHYAFLDDDIIYDAQYGASEESEADKRIREETPRSRVQHNFSSVEDTRASRQETVPTTSGDIIKEILIQEQNRRNANPPIGTSANSSVYHPAWKSYLLQGELDSSLPYIEMGDSTINIPQLEVKQRDFTYKAIKDTDSNSSLYGYVFPDGSSVTLKEDENNEFLLFLQENNASSDSENFSIEIYEVEEQSGKEFLTPLGFSKRPQRDMIVDGIMLDNEVQGEIDPSEDPTLSEYYFEIEVDEEIDPAILTKAVQSGRFADMRDLESFANSATIGAGEDAMLSKLGNSATNIYGLSLSEIASMSEEALDMAQTRAGQLAGLYDEEDNTNGCD